jgi:protein-tyrosine phosphatase
MAEVLLRRHLEQAGVDATVSSAGLLRGGVAATDHGVAAMADRGLDLSRHASRRIDADMLERADLVIAMARQHVREAAVLVPGVLSKTFTLK